MNLHHHWAAVTECLRSASRLLDVDSTALTSFDEWLTHNELELALDELESLAITHAARAGFWDEMAHAAQTMNLGDHAARYRTRAAEGR